MSRTHFEGNFAFRPKNKKLFPEMSVFFTLVNMQIPRPSYLQVDRPQTGDLHLDSVSKVLKSNKKVSHLISKHV